MISHLCAKLTSSRPAGATPPAFGWALSDAVLLGSLHSEPALHRAGERVYAFALTDSDRHVIQITACSLLEWRLEHVEKILAMRQPQA